MTRDSSSESSSEKPKRKKLFSIRNLIILVLLAAVVAVVGNKLGLFDRLPFVGTHTAAVDQPVTEVAETTRQAAPETPAAEHAAGGTVADVMNRHFIAVEESVTAGHAVQLLKDSENPPQVVFVTDAGGRLVGACSPAKLLVAPEEELVKDLMEHDIEAVEDGAAVAEVKQALHVAGSGPVPVVDKGGLLIGVVSAAALEGKVMAGGHAPQSGAMHASAAPAHEAEAPAPEEKMHAAKAPEAPEAQPAAGEHAQAPAGEHASGQMEQMMAAAAAGHGAAQAQHAAAKSGEHQPEGGGQAAAAPSAHGAAATAGAAHGEGGHEAAPAASQPTGVAFVDAMIEPLKYELDDRWWGWRPNDILDFTDNVNNFQLGVLEVTRRAAVVLAERISRTGTIEQFDVNVQNAMNWLMVKSDRYWLPSPEYKYKAAIEELEKYRDRLIEGRASFYTRQDNLIPLLVAFKDLLGSCEENLVKSKEKDGNPVSFFQADDYFYYAQGVVSAMGTMLKAVAVDFHATVQSRRGADELHHAIHWCDEAEKVQPWLILDSSYSSIFANHRVNLAGPISHIRFHLGVLITTLST